MSDKKNTTVYFLENTMYINVTNLCTCRCVFCIRDLSETVGDADLRLDGEVNAHEIIEEIKKNSPDTRDEIVFCGYGEPLLKLDIVKQVAKFIKENYPEIPVRINTNGHANLIHKKDVVPELVGLIDRISVSLNAENAEKYGELNRCSYDPDVAYKNVKEFIGKCQKYGIDTTATIVVGFRDYVVDVEKCREIVESLGAKFKIREWLEEGYS